MTENDKKQRMLELFSCIQAEAEKHAVRVSESSITFSNLLSLETGPSVGWPTIYGGFHNSTSSMAKGTSLLPMYQL